MPNTREKLIEIFESAERPITVPHRMDAEQARKYVFGEMADHLIANGVTVQKWIPVTERLPEVNVPVLVYDGNYVDGREFYDLSYVSKYGVTHWMELPEPPKGE